MCAGPGGLVFLGHPGTGHATGFIISKKHRLVATAAHVADHAFEDGKVMLALLDGSSTSYTIEHVWYHPGIIRWLDDGLYARSDDPRDGEVANRVPDLAVVQLSKGVLEFPEGLQLAGDDELNALNQQKIGCLSYPGASNDRWPEVGTSLHATFTPCSVGKTTDFSENANAPNERRQWVRFDSRVGAGSSGAPLFLSNGHVVAIKNMRNDTGTQMYRDSGLRVDCLRELLAFHALADMPQVAVDKARSNPDWGPDPRLSPSRKASRLVREADSLRRSGMYAQASEKCNQAIDLVPKYSGAILQRCKVNLFHLSINWTQLSAEERLQYAERALADSYRCLEFFPEWNEPYLYYSQCVVYVALLRPDITCLRRAITTLEEMLGENWRNEALTNTERSFAINCRAKCPSFPR